VERLFAERTDKRIRRGTFRSVGELVRAIREDIRAATIILNLLFGLGSVDCSQD